MPLSAKRKMQMEGAHCPPVEWVKTTARLSLENDKTCEVSGFTHGGFVVHQPIEKDNKGLHALTSQTTGLRLALLRSEEDARRIAEYLWSHFCLVFRKKSSKEIVESLPSNIIKWVTQCNHAREYLQPPQ